jgi:dephospho-CoA kinase
VSRPLRIGLIGAIAAGKSRVAARLAELGAWVVDGDRIGHEVLARPEIAAQAQAEFGSGIVGDDGKVDRKKLGPLVFGDPTKMAALERLLHPPMRRAFEAELARASNAPGTPLVAFDAAVLLEKGWDDLVDEILFVDAARALRLERIAARGWTPEELARRESAQWPVEKKKARAHHVVTCDDWRACRQAVDALYEAWTTPTGVDRSSAPQSASA